MATQSAEHRIAVVTGLPAPYREPVFEELAGRAGVALRVFYAARGHDDVGWEPTSSEARRYDHTFLWNAMPTRGRRLPMFGYANLGITGELARFRPTYLIVYGYNQLVHWLTFAHARRRGVPYALRSDSNIHLDESTSWQSWVRRAMLRRAVRNAHAVLSVGTANEAYWRKYGAIDEQIVPSPFSVDIDALRIRAARQTRSDDGPIRLLYAGRLLPRKGIDLLLPAFTRLVDQANVTLTMVGDGPERSRLESTIPPSVRARICWLGRKTNAEVIDQMAQADLFVLGSRYEPWGLVLNEAMAAGLPVVAHRKVGGAIDLIRPGQTGWFFDELQSDSLLETLRNAVRSRAQLRQMGANAAEHIKGWSTARTVDGMVCAADRSAGIRTGQPVESRPTPRRVEVACG